MKHPFAVGIGVGAVGLFAWWKRHTLMSWFERVRHPFSGAEDNTDAIVRRLLDAKQPMVLVVAVGQNGSRVQALVDALRTSGAPRTIIDAEGWPSAQAAAPAN